MRPDTFPKSGTITVTELRSQPGEYLSAVSRCGESFLITKSGRPVAKDECPHKRTRKRK